MDTQPGRGSAAARAAAVRAEQRATDRRRNLLVVAGVGVLVAAIVVVGFLVQSGRDTTGDTAADPAASGSSTTSPTATASDGTPVAAADTYGLGVGDPSAPVKVEVFEDFLCPFCQQYEETGREALRQAATDGRAYVVYRPIAFLNEYSVRSLNAFAVVLNTAGPDVALDFHDRLYDNQPAEGGQMPSDAWLIQQAIASGADGQAITEGITSMAYQQWVTNGADDASKRKVAGTPTVFVDGRPVQGATSIEDLVTRTGRQIDAGQ